MNTPSSTRRHSTRQACRQRGIALIVALILLVVATLTGMAGIRSTTLQEKMAGNQYDRSLAMQAAEAALRAAEALIAADPSNVAGSVDCRTVACPAVPPNTFTPDSANWQNVAGAFAMNAGLMGSTPQFLIQRLGDVTALSETGLDRSANTLQAGGGHIEPPRPVFRVTARSGTPTAANDRAVVFLSARITAQ